MIVVGRIDDRLSREIGIARPQNNSNDPKWNFLPFIGIALIRPHDRRIDEAISNSSGPPSETRIPPNRRGGERGRREGEGGITGRSLFARGREGGEEEEDGARSMRNLDRQLRAVIPVVRREISLSYTRCPNVCRQF